MKILTMMTLILMTSCASNFNPYQLSDRDFDRYMRMEEHNLKYDKMNKDYAMQFGNALNKMAESEKQNQGSIFQQQPQRETIIIEKEQPRQNTWGSW